MKKRVVLAGSILLLMGLALFLFLRERGRVMDAPVLSSEKISLFMEQRTPGEPETSFALLINGTPAAYEQKEERYYIPKNLSEKHWRGTLTASVDGVPASVAWMEDEAFSDMRQAVAEGHEFRCLIYDDHQYVLADVLFTGLPVMSIDGAMGETGARMTVFDPILNSGEGYQTEELLSYYNIRGNASKRFEKLGYRLELFYNDGRAGKDVALLGMRSDNDWQLKAMYSDRSKLRDKLSIELWNQIAGQNDTQADTGCRMEYLELILNGEYQGLYGLVEPTDYKSLGLDKTKDLIYKVASDEWPDDGLFDESEAAQSFTCAGVNIRQGGKSFYPGIWEPFRTFWDSGYEMESEDDLKQLYECIDLQNFIDYHLYYNVIAGMDNRFKNIIYSVKMQGDGTFVIRRIPWDQNYSWGDDFQEGEDKDIKNIRYNPELCERWLNEEVFRGMLEYDPELMDAVKETWKHWRESFLTEDYWKAYAREQMAYLLDSGAFTRDSVRWPDSGNVPGTEEIEGFIDSRFSWLDGYLGIDKDTVH